MKRITMFRSTTILRGTFMVELNRLRNAVFWSSRIGKGAWNHAIDQRLGSLAMVKTSNWKSLSLKVSWIRRRNETSSS